MDPDVALQGRLNRVLEECSSTGPKACGDIPDCATESETPAGLTAPHHDYRSAAI